MDNPINYIDPEGKRGISVRPPIRRGDRNGGDQIHVLFIQKALINNHICKLRVFYTGNGLREIFRSNHNLTIRS